MAKTITDAEALKLTVDDQGIVWYIHGEGMPHSSGLTAWSFLKSPLLGKASRIRMVGSAANAGLLHQLYECKLKGALESIQVCSPMCCDTGDERRDPEVVLYRMRKYNLSPSLGGWHEFTLHDFPSYLLAAHYRTRNDVNEYTRQLVLAHPAWHALSFIEGLDIDSIGRLVSLVIDPRWFVDADQDPDAGVRLDNYLGLHVKSFGTRQSADDWRTNRSRLVLDCWKTAEAQPKILPATPRNFLWKAWAAKGGSNKGDFVACRMFVSFLRATWTQTMCQGPQATHLFVPEHFFDDKDMSVAYKEHLEKFKPNV